MERGDPDVIHPWHDLPAGHSLRPRGDGAWSRSRAAAATSTSWTSGRACIRLDRVLYSAHALSRRLRIHSAHPARGRRSARHPGAASTSRRFPGCQIDCRPLGVLKMLDRGEPDDKILGVPVHDPYYSRSTSTSPTFAAHLKEVEHFFHIYKDLEGQRVEINGWGKSDEAMRR